MYKYFAYIIFCFIIGCMPSQPDKKKNEFSEDTVVSKTSGQIPIEDFDILMQESEDPGRVTWQNPEMVISKMGNIDNLVVADIGTGTGYFAIRIVKKGGSVIGIDIDQKSIDYIEERKSELSPEIANRLTTRLSYPDDPRLTVNEADWVIIINTYYIIENRINYLKKVKNGLRRNGKIMIVDYKVGDMPVGPDDVIKVPITKAITEVKSAGLRILEIDNSSLQYQYIIVAQR